jgi:CDP-glucose 4,6-dehydratase
VKELVKMAVALWGKGDWKDVSDPAQPHEATLLQLDINLAMQELHWKPKLTAAEAIGWTLEWYKEPLDKQAAFSLHQIKNYLAL